MNRFILLLLLIPMLSFSQSTQRWKETYLKDSKIFTDLEVALTYSDEVEILDLGGQHLKEIPKQISTFKNLRVLLLGWRPKKDLDRKTHKTAKNIGGGYLHLDRKKGTVIDYNYIQNIPSEVMTLDKLEYLELDYNLLIDLPNELVDLKSLKQISLYGTEVASKNHSIVEELEPKMPNCEFLTTNNYIKQRQQKQ